MPCEAPGNSRIACHFAVTRIKTHDIEVAFYFNVSISKSSTCLFRVYLVARNNLKTTVTSGRTSVPHSEARVRTALQCANSWLRTKMNQNWTMGLSSRLRSRDFFKEKELFFKNYLGNCFKKQCANHSLRKINEIKISGTGNKASLFFKKQHAAKAETTRLASAIRKRLEARFAFDLTLPWEQLSH